MSSRNYKKEYSKGEEDWEKKEMVRTENECISLKRRWKRHKRERVVCFFLANTKKLRDVWDYIYTFKI